jgi:hypothetical protein
MVGEVIKELCKFIQQQQAHQERLAKMDTEERVVISLNPNPNGPLDESPRDVV